MYARSILCVPTELKRVKEDLPLEIKMSSFECDVPQATQRDSMNQ